MKINNYYLFFICFFISSLFYLVDYYAYYPNFGGDSSRLYLFYFNDFLNSINDSFDTNFPNKNYPYTNLIFFLLINKYLSFFINDLFLYHLNNILPLILGLYGLCKLLNSFFNINDNKFNLYLIIILSFSFL